MAAGQKSPEINEKCPSVEQTTPQAPQMVPTSTRGKKVGLTPKKLHTNKNIL
jgi:hypothetical protein